jgi:hypothetical protein
MDSQDIPARECIEKALRSIVIDAKSAAFSRAFTPHHSDEFVTFCPFEMTIAIGLNAKSLSSHIAIRRREGGSNSTP